MHQNPKFKRLLRTFLAFVITSSCLFSAGAAAQSVPISGKISDPSGNPITGASVIEKGTANGTTTNSAGEFRMKVSDANATLSVSSIGFNDMEVPLNGRKEVDVTMTIATTALQQVVVVGYGTQRKIDVTGSIATISGAQIEKQSSFNPLSALQGKVAGVQISNSGSPGAPPQVTIRGVGTVFGNTNPLYVVDGVWYDDVSFLNSADIASISVLKDASAESIYGIRAANGVILITTKQGRQNEKPVVNYNAYAGNQVVTNQVKMANGPEYAQMINEVDVLNNAPGQYPDPNSFGTTDWYHLILQNAFVTNHQLN